MKSIWNLAAIVLAPVAAVAQVQPPYTFHGLHADLVFTEAVVLTEKLGGKCQITPAGTPDGGIGAQCEYAHCSAQNPAGDCKAQGAAAAAELTIGALPILSISLEAPDESARLTRAILVYEGSNDVFAEYLQQTFGPPNEVPRADKKSWSHSRRLLWTQGSYLLSLWDKPKLLIVGAERSQE